MLPGRAEESVKLSARITCLQLLNMEQEDYFTQQHPMKQIIREYVFHMKSKCMYLHGMERG
jgi:hypothetical protein